MRSIDKKNAYLFESLFALKQRNTSQRFSLYFREKERLSGKPQVSRH